MCSIRSQRPFFYSIARQLSIGERQVQATRLVDPAANSHDFAVDNPGSAATISVNMQEPERFTLHRPSEEELVRAIKAGDKTAYGEIYDRFAPLVRAICHDWTHNLADAQDLAQDVFLRAYLKLGELRKPKDFGPWVVGITRRRCSEWRRQKLREQRKHAARGVERGIGEGANRQEEDGQLLRLVASLDPNERLALHTFYLQGKSAEDARRIMGLSRSGFYRVLEKARKRLERLIDREREDIR